MDPSSENSSQATDYPTLDVYTHPGWEQNVEAAQLTGQTICRAVNSVRLTASNEKGLPIQKSEALETA